ncbi:hypothetical protein HPB50_011458 [Hyalomma asiaticum]|uniref:Uncharacterized protein n=1 Tax=Hyalomma asiaticum TaxID=266040 RepID=A0ACB7SPG4_HYAAI|nr:hypothetical protein HPB50_011458 [Hyalomma asiaticum]
MATKGNCSGDADAVLISVEEILNAGKLTTLAQKQAREERLAGFLKRIELREQAPDDEFQHNYNRPVARDAVLYYLAGYVVKKAGTFSTCTDCVSTLTDTCNVPPAALMTEVRSYVPSALQQPSSAPTCLLSGIEGVIE